MIRSSKILQAMVDTMSDNLTTKDIIRHFLFQQWTMTEETFNYGEYFLQKVSFRYLISTVK